jgi:PAS domain S-box-containing protein
MSVKKRNPMKACFALLIIVLLCIPCFSIADDTDRRDIGGNELRNDDDTLKGNDSDEKPVPTETDKSERTGIKDKKFKAQKKTIAPEKKYKVIRKHKTYKKKEKVKIIRERPCEKQECPEVKVVSVDAPKYALSIYSIPIAVASIIIFLLGLIILILERASIISISFFLASLAVSEWFFAFSFLYSCTDETSAMFWAKTGYIGIPFVPALIYMLVVLSFNIFRRWKILVLINFLLSAIFSITILSIDTLIPALNRYWWGFYPQYGFIGIPLIIFFSFIAFMCFFHTWKEYHDAAPLSSYRKRINILAAALVILCTGAVDIIAKYGIPVYPFGYVPFTIFFLMGAILIRRYRQADIFHDLSANAIAETMTDALFAVDRTGIIRMANNAACGLFGYAGSDLIGKSAAKIVSPDIFLVMYNEILKKGILQNHELNYCEKDGGSRILSLSASSIHQSGELEPAGMLFVARDITELRQKEAAFERANNELIERQKIPEKQIKIASDVRPRPVKRKQSGNIDWDVAFIFKPTIGVPRDLYEFYRKDGLVRGIALCDVSGHKVSTNLINLLSKMIISRHLNNIAYIKLDIIAEKIHKDLIKKFHSIDNYLTGILLRFTGNKVEYINASHPDLLAKQHKTGNVIKIRTGDDQLNMRRLGKDESDTPFEVISFSMEEGDALLLYTDGLINCVNSNNEKYGSERVMESFRKSPDDPAQEILDYIIHDFNEFIGNSPMADDMTLIVLKR